MRGKRQRRYAGWRPGDVVVLQSVGRARCVVAALGHARRSVCGHRAAVVGYVVVCALMVASAGGFLTGDWVAEHEHPTTGNFGGDHERGASAKATYARGGWQERTRAAGMGGDAEGAATRARGPACRCVADHVTCCRRVTGTRKAVRPGTVTVPGELGATRPVPDGPPEALP